MEKITREINDIRSDLDRNQAALGMAQRMLADVSKDMDRSRTALKEVLKHIDEPHDGVETNATVDVEEVKKILEDNMAESNDLATPVSDLVTELRKRGYFKGVGNGDAGKSLSTQLSRADGVYNHGRIEGWSVEPKQVQEQPSQLTDEQLAVAAEEVIRELKRQNENDLSLIDNHVRMGAPGVPSEIDRKVLGIARNKYARFLSPPEKDTLREQVRNQVRQSFESGEQGMD